MQESREVGATADFQLMIKPGGPSCNLRCTYCYYLPKERYFTNGGTKMSLGTLEELTRQFIGSRDRGTVSFAWQGGEPTLMGIDFFRKAVALQGKYRRPGVAIENTLQTNGTLLDDQWCQFLRDHHFLVGLSVDGPGPLHDLYRKDRKGKPTSGSVVRASRLLRNHGVEFNTLTVVNRENARHPLQVYRFLRNVIGARYMQFIPCVEPRDFESVPPQRWNVEALPSLDDPEARPDAKGSFVTEWSVDPEDYGSFLIKIFDEWVRRDVGKVFVINLEAALGSWLGLPSSTCTFADRCGNALAIEHDGSVYSCDHYVYPEHRLGLIHESDLIGLATSDRQSRFGQEKADGLPNACRECEFLFACHGECPKNRFLSDPNGGTGLNYLCKGLQRFFVHIDPWMRFMAGELRAGRKAENVMERSSFRHKAGGGRSRPPGLDRLRP